MISRKAFYFPVLAAVFYQVTKSVDAKTFRDKTYGCKGCGTNYNELADFRIIKEQRAHFNQFATRANQLLDLTTFFNSFFEGEIVKLTAAIEHAVGDSFYQHAQDRLHEGYCKKCSYKWASFVLYDE
jgi:hypothetical protein